MERLRFVARGGDGDPAAIVADTVEALVSLRPGPSELVSVCRNLVERHVTCGPLWWLCAELLAKPEALAHAWTLAERIVGDPTADRLAAALPEQSLVLVVGEPHIAGTALCRRPDVRVLAVGTAVASGRLVRRLDRAGTHVTVVAPETVLGAARAATVVLVEVEACDASTAVVRVGNAVAALAARSFGTPVWMVTGRGRCLPHSYVEAIGQRVRQPRPWDDEFEPMPVDAVSVVVGPSGVGDMGETVLAAECEALPGLLRGR